MSGRLRKPIPMPPLLDPYLARSTLERLETYYVSKLQGLSTNDGYRSHRRADDLLCAFLWEAGYEAIVDAYRSVRSDVGFSY